VTHKHSQHTVCDGVSSVTEEGYHPGVPRQWDRECGKGSTGSVFSFFRGCCNGPAAYCSTLYAWQVDCDSVRTLELRACTRVQWVR